jgi:hypothetical protein
MVEAGARCGYERLAGAMLVMRGMRLPSWGELSDERRTDLCAHFRIDFTAALAVAEAEGVVLCAVPDALAMDRENYERHGMDYCEGHNACRAATLAGKVTL